MDLTANSLMGKASGLMNAFINIVVVLIIIGIIIAVVLLIINFLKYSQYRCIIFSRDGFGNINIKEDKAGIFVKKRTQNKMFYLRRAKVGLDPDKVPYILNRNKKTVFLFEDSLRNFRFISPIIDNEKVILRAGEAGINWALEAYENQKKRWENSKLMQFLPWIGLGIVFIAVIIISIQLLKEIPEAVKVLKEVALALKDTGASLAQASSGTKVI